MSLRWRWVTGLLVACLVTLAMLVAWLLQSDGGTRAVLERVPGLEVVGPSGAMRGGPFQADRVVWRRDATVVTMDDVRWQDLRWDWHPSRSPWLTLGLDGLMVQTITVTTGASSKPRTAPTTLRWPVALVANQARVKQLHINDNVVLSDLSANVALGADAGAQHRVEQLALTWHKMRWQGAASVGTDAPLPVVVDLQGRTTSANSLASGALNSATISANPTPWQGDLQLRGPLEKLNASLNATLQNNATGAPQRGALQVQTTLAPFAPWPVTALTASLQDVDVSAFAVQAPSTKLQGQATLVAAARDAPFTLDAQLQNDSPGRWDEKRLPVTTLTLKASGTLSQPDTIDLQALDLALHQNAGRISGQGRWAVQQLSLDVQAQNVRPVALDNRWAAMTLSGPLTFTATGLPKPTDLGAGTANHATPLDATVTAQINGQMDARPSPSDKRTASLAPQGQTLPNVQLTFDAALSKTNPTTHGYVVSVPRWSVSAAGSQADGRSTFKRNDQGDVALQTNATWRNFDPLPWYAGEPGSAWREGGHRLNGQLQADVSWPSGGVQGASSVNGTSLQRALAWIEQARGDITLNVDNSRLANVPLQGKATWGHTGTAPANVDLRIVSGTNTAQVTGQLAANADNDRWKVDALLPQTATLAPALRLVPALAAWQPTSGAAQLDVRLQGRWPPVASEGSASLSGTQIGPLRVRQATARWRTNQDPQAPLSLWLEASDLSGTTPVPVSGAAATDGGKPAATPSIASLRVSVEGTLASHRMEADAASPLRPPGWSNALTRPASQAAAASSTGGNAASNTTKVATAEGTTLRLRGDGAWTSSDPRSNAMTGGVWRARLADVNLGSITAPSATPLLAAQDLRAQVRVDAQQRITEANLEPSSARIVGAKLAWQQARWQRDANASELIDVQAQLEPTRVAPWLASALPGQGWSGDLQLGGTLSLRSTAQRVTVDAVLERQSGDLMVLEDGVQQALGLTQGRIAVKAQDGVWQITQALVGNNLGVLAGAQTLRVPTSAQWPNQQTPLTGALSWRVDNLSTLAPWLPAGWRATGDLNAVATLGGRLGAPEYTGNLAGEQLTLRNALEGIDLRDGNLRMVLRGDDAKIDALRFKGGDGELRVEGGATFGVSPALNLRLMASKFQLLGRVDRRIVLSGNTNVLVQADALQADGKLMVDEGLIDLSRRDAPSLDSDVTVQRRKTSDPSNVIPDDAEKPSPETESTTPINKRGPLANTRLNVQLDLGPQLKLKGRGINTRLGGLLTVTSPNNRLAVNGAVRAESGTYSAYGQNLAIERGVITFTGAVDNPRLDIAAERPNIDVRVGVAITGTAQNPRVRLFSEPEMIDTDKLSWLMLGRAPEALGRADTALLQRAALALWAGEDGDAPSDAMLKTIGLDELSVRQTETGDVRDTVIRVGKQIGRRWYIGYERGVNTSTGTWQVVYRIAQRLTVRAQSGSDNSLDAIWTWRWN